MSYGQTLASICNDRSLAYWLEKIAAGKDDLSPADREAFLAEAKKRVEFEADPCA